MRLLSNFLRQTRQTSVYAKPNRFYKSVHVDRVAGDDTRPAYNILLDNHKLKTLAGNVVQVESEPLALAIAQEWDCQAETIKKTHMRLTGLTFTSIDNPFKETKESLTSKIMDFVETDTTLYFAADQENLLKLQNEKWAPIIKWVCDAHKLDIQPTTNLMELPHVGENDRAAIAKWLMSHNFWTLTGIQYGVEAAKSIIISMALFGGRIAAEDAAELSRLEQLYQTKIWGNVEWSHDVEHQELCTRLAAAMLFYYFTSNSHVVNKMDAAIG